MAKLNPPQISSKLPAFIGKRQRENNSPYQMIIPFNLNKAVGINEFKSMKLLIKTVQSNTDKSYCTTNMIYYDSNTRNYKAYFDLNFIPVPGQYYKVQLAFIDDVTDPEHPEVGYYSSVGVIKCISEPKIEISGRNGGSITTNTYTYVGTYTQNLEEADITEKVYSYEFNLYDEANNLIATSGRKIHNSSKDQSTNSSSDSWTIHKKLRPNEVYSIEYNVITMNGGGQTVPLTSNPYPIIDTELVKPNVHANLSAISYPDDGYVEIKLIGDGSKTLVNGSFILLRADSKDNYDSWYELTKFYLSSWNAMTSKIICKDHTIEQGVHYIYAIQAFNANGLYSDRMKNIEGPVYCSFEDAFLWDGTRQLKIKFNPKISSFKSTILETKTDTIGGKYPFVFRNGNVEYKEFQISGLLSLLSDENNLFLTNLYEQDDLERIETSADPIQKTMGISRTQLTSENYYLERQFKLEALKWLTDGKPKLFRSPSEGNYIIRLMNTSLVPNDTLGRMLHTFNTNACEIAECNFENLQSYGFTMPSYTEMRTMRIAQIDLNNPPGAVTNILSKEGWEQLEETDSRKSYNSYQEYLEKDESVKTIILPYAYMASITATPSTIFKYNLANLDSYELGIGLTGTYIFDDTVLNSTPLISITPIGSWGDDAYLTYGYYDEGIDTFSYIYNIDIKDKITQVIGMGEGINYIDTLTDLRKKVGMFHYIKIQPRDIVYIYRKNGQLFYNNTGLRFNADEAISTALYYIVDFGQEIFSATEYLDGRNPTVIKNISDISFDFSLNGSDNIKLKVNGTEFYDANNNLAYTTSGYETLTAISSIDSLYIGDGLILDMVYQEKTILYSIELTNEAVKYYKKIWETTQTDSAYRIYLDVLYNTLKEMEDEYNVEFAL